MRQNTPVAPDADPGTGTQVHSFATPPEDPDRPNSRMINGRVWKVGHDYIDTEVGDVCELVEIIGKSPWCSTRDPEKCPPKLIFEYERYGRSDFGSHRVTFDPNGPKTLKERFIERYTVDPPLGAPEPPWP